MSQNGAKAFDSASTIWILVSMFRLGLYVILSFTILFLQESVFAKPLSLKELGQKALEASPDYKGAKNSYQASLLQSKNTFSGFLPSLDLSSTHGPQGYDPNTALAPNWGNSTQLTLSETIYDNGENLKLYKMSKLAAEQNELQMKKAKGQVLLNLVSLYYEWCFSVLQNQFTEKYAKEVVHQFQMVTDQFHQGVKTHSDFLRFKTQAQRSDLDLINSKKVVDKNRQALVSLLGITDSAASEALDFELVDKPTHNFLKTSQLTPENLIENKILKIKEKISGEQIALIERRWWPQLNLAGSAQYGSSNYIFGQNIQSSWDANHSTTWNVLLTFKMNFLDWGVRSRNVEIQKFTEDSSQQTLRSQMLSAYKELLGFKTDLAQSEETLKISQELEKNEQLNFRQLDKDYHEGRISYLDLITGLSNLVDAQTKRIRADFDAATLYTKQKYYLGTLDENNLDK